MRAAFVLALSLALAACGEETPGPIDAADAAPEPEPEPAPDPAPQPDPEPPACDGLDADGDGVCDRERADWSRAATVEPGTHRGDTTGSARPCPPSRPRGWPTPRCGR